MKMKASAKTASTKSAPIITEKLLLFDEIAHVSECLAD